MKEYRPNNINELLKIINEEQVIIYAKGTSLNSKYKGKYPKPIVYINKIDELFKIDKFKDNNLSIGSMLCVSDLLKYKNLLKPVKHVLENQKNLEASLGGLIFNTEKLPLIALILYSYNGYLNLSSINSNRYIPISEFYDFENMKINIKSNELVKSLILPLAQFKKFIFVEEKNFVYLILYKINNNRIEDIRISILINNVIRSKYIENLIISSNSEDLDYKIDNIMHMYIQEISYHLKINDMFNKNNFVDKFKTSLKSIF